MDVAYYLSELLGQLGEVNVPGLGYFVQTRIEGYYNAADSTFYPPKNKVQFEPQPIDDDDDTLAQYIAEKKNISLASSRYFTEKYISNLKQEAIMKDVPLADLGFLHIQGSNVTFKPADVMQNDPAVYGYSPIRMEKLEGPSFTHQMDSYSQVTKEIESTAEAAPLKLPEADPAYELPPASDLSYEQVIREAEAMLSKPEPTTAPTPAPAPEPAPYVPPVYEPYKPEPVTYQPEPEAYIAPINPDDQEEFVFHGKTYVPPERRGLKWLWITLLIILGVFVVGVLGMLALHKFRPALYNQIRGIAPEPVTIKAPVHADSLITDSLKDTTRKASGVITDTTVKKGYSSAPIDTFATTRYEILAGSFEKMSEAQRSIKNYATLGFTARVLQHAQGPRIKLTIGTYFTDKEAQDKRQEIINTGKVSSGRLQVQTYLPEINPQK